MARIIRPRATALPAPTPISVATSQAWEGNDGSWSTFVIRVGTPEQVFHILISTNGQETWVPVPEGCLPTDPSNCGELRGVLPFRNQHGTGFLVNASSTWEPQNLYELGNGAQLNYTGNGLYGFDTVGLQLPQSGGISLQHQVVAGIATKDFYLGQFGLGDKPTNFTNFNSPQPSFMWTLKNQSHIPSLSWAYSAGAPYRLKKVGGSLTLGGYDASRFTPNNLNFTFSPDDSKYLTVGLQAIQATNTLGGTMSLLSSGILTVIDSTFPEIWLPTSSCSIFESAFGLNYDPHTDRYLVNSTTRDSLLALNPSVTFKLGNSIDGGDSTSITLPYAAFDLVANSPIYPNATRYFPLRRAANDTQYTLGRTFLQEAYVIADYERRNFSVSQAVFAENTPARIIPILSPFIVLTESKGGLSQGALIGIIIGAVAVVIFFAVGIFILFRRKKREKERLDNEAKVEQERQEALAREMEYKHASGRSELMSQEMITREKYASDISELIGSDQRHELRTLESPVELPGSPVLYSAVSPMGSPRYSEKSELGSPPGSPRSTVVGSVLESPRSVGLGIVSPSSEAGSPKLFRRSRD